MSRKKKVEVTWYEVRELKKTVEVDIGCTDDDAISEALGNSLDDVGEYYGTIDERWATIDAVKSYSPHAQDISEDELA